MTKIKHSIALSLGTISPTHKLQVFIDVISNAYVNPEVRCYKSTDSPSAWQPVPNVPDISSSDEAFVQFNIDGSSLYVVDFRSSIVPPTNLGRVQASNYPCFPTAPPIGYVVTRMDGKVALKASIYEVLTTELLFSVDGGTTFRTMHHTLQGPTIPPAPGSFINQWLEYITDADLLSLGYVDFIPNIVFKRTDNGCIIPYGKFYIGDALPAEFEATLNETDVTTPGGSDGTIVTNIVGGSGNFTFVWADGPTTQNRTGLLSGTYTVTITDVVTAQVETLSVMVNEPQAPQPPPEGTFIRFPVLNSLRMINREDPLNCFVMEKLDNRLFCEQELLPNQVRSVYYQLVQYCDTLIHQMETDFSALKVQLISMDTEEVVKYFSSELKEDNLSAYVDYDINIRHNPDVVNTSRVFFDSLGAFPIPLAVGDSFKIKNNLDGFDGDYTIVDIRIDSTGNYYFVINLTYTAPTLTSAATGRFFPVTVDFNVWEAVLDWAGVPEGLYYLLVTGINLDGSDSNIQGISEPISLATRHANSLAIDYRNNDNFSITWQTGYTGRVRIKGWFIGQPTSELSTSRNSNGDPVNINGKPRRVMQLFYESLPRYLHEKLVGIFTCDNKEINGEEFGNTEPPSEIQWSKNRLGNSSVKLEFKNWLGKYNSDDIGTVADTGNIEQIGGGFIKRIE